MFLVRVPYQQVHLVCIPSSLRPAFPLSTSAHPTDLEVLSEFGPSVLSPGPWGRGQVQEARLGCWGGGRAWIALGAQLAVGFSGGLCKWGRQGRLEGQGSQLGVLGRQTQGLSTGRPTDRGGVQQGELSPPSDPGLPGPHSL